MAILCKQTFIRFSIIILALTSLSLSASEPKKTIPNPFPHTIKTPYNIKNFIKTHQGVSTAAVIFNIIGAFLCAAGQGVDVNFPPTNELLRGAGKGFIIAGTAPFAAKYAHHCYKGYKAKNLKSAINPLNPHE